MLNVFVIEPKLKKSKTNKGQYFNVKKFKSIGYKSNIAMNFFIGYLLFLVIPSLFGLISSPNWSNIFWSAILVITIYSTLKKLPLLIVILKINIFLNLLLVIFNVAKHFHNIQNINVDVYVNVISALIFFIFLMKNIVKEPVDVINENISETRQN